MGEQPRSFPDPESAVERVNALLAAEDWETLAEYYDLAGSELTREDVARWEWFEAGGRPVADPRGRTGPHHPFPRGATYREREVDDSGVCRVTVELPPGLADPHGGPAVRTFALVRHDAGWRLLAPDDGRLGTSRATDGR